MFLLKVGLMIVTISGSPGSGKSTVARAVAKELNLKHFSAGDFMREMASERGVSLAELTALSEKDVSIDREIDERTKKLIGMDDFVIDSRLAFHFLPGAVKIFLKVDPKVAAKRIWKDVQEKKRTAEEFASEEAVLNGILSRQASEIKRYKEYYNVDFLDESNFDFVLDTSDLNIEQAVAKVLDFLRKK